MRPLNSFLNIDTSVCEIAQDLISFESDCNSRTGLQKERGRFLEEFEFEVVLIEAGGASDLWARIGSVEPLFAFAGDADV